MPQHLAFPASRGSEAGVADRGNPQHGPGLAPDAAHRTSDPEMGAVMVVSVEIEQLKGMMAAVCRNCGLPEDKIGVVVDHYLAGELRGKASHGVAKFCFEARSFGERQAAPAIVNNRGALAVIDAHREVGPISAAFAVTVARRKAAEFGVGVVGMINTQRYGILAQWSEEIARHGLIGIAANTSRAEAVVDGGTAPVLGVNPLSFSIPTCGEPFVADMSTTLAPMGVLWECRRSGERLPEGCFVDQDGHLTDDPDRAVSAIIFGQHRGFAVSLLVQILTGSLFGFPMGSQVSDTWNTGYTFIALDPSFGGAAGAAQSNTRLLEELATGGAGNGRTLRLPGRHSRAREAQAQCAGTVDLPEQVLQRLRARAAGDFESD